MIQHIFNDFRSAIFAGVILVITFIVAFLFNYFANKYLRKGITQGRIDPTSYQFAKHIISSIIYLIGIAMALVQIPEMKVVGHSILAGAGVISLVAGLASQQALSNVMSGILIVLFKPFKINDRITLRGSFTGIVEDINLRQVVIRDFENNRIIVPNSIISNDIIVNTNTNEPKVCKTIEIGIGYDSDMDKALAIMQEEAAKHPLHIDNRSPEDIAANKSEIVGRVVELADSSVNLKIWVWANNAGDGFALQCDLLRSIKNRFDAEEIEIPYSYQNVVIKNEIPQNV